jgi:glycosyltransferase involved in cell wall biosynthesis
MRVLFFTEGTPVSPASRIRVYEYLARCRGQGSCDPVTVSFTSEAYCRRIVAGERTGWVQRAIEKLRQARAVLSLLSGCRSADAVFIQRVLLPRTVQRLVRALNPRIVYDFDDAVYLGSRKRAVRFACQVRLASRVLAVSRAAAEEAVSRGADPSRVGVLPSPVDCSIVRVRWPGLFGTFTVGWIGSPATTGYLEAIWPELAGFAGNHPEVRFLFIGARPFDTGAFSGRTSFEPWSCRAERKLLSLLDTGVMPLADDPWCRGKGGYKLIQYMAAGVACLASPVGANLEIVQEGQTGFFVRSPGEWRGRLEQLFADRALCDSLGAAGRQRAETLYDYSKTAGQFLRALAEASSIQAVAAPGRAS